MDTIEERTKAVAKSLSDPFYADEVEWKIQSKTKDGSRALVVPYIKARALMQRLDDAVGISNWTDSYMGVDGGFNCALSIRINGEWITKNDAAEHVVMTTYDDGQRQTIQSLKGTYSGAFKRVCTTWGIGRYLYDIPRRWVPLVDKKKFDIPTLAPEFYPTDATPKGFRSSGKVVEPEDLTTPDTDAPKEEKEPTPEHKQEELPQRERVVADETGISFAKQHNIPEGIGIPLAGKTLGDALNDEALGAGIITYLAGIQPNKKGDSFDTGGNENMQKLQKAALVLYDNVLHPPA